MLRKIFFTRLSPDNKISGLMLSPFERILRNFLKLYIFKTFMGVFMNLKIMFPTHTAIMGIK